MSRSFIDAELFDHTFIMGQNSLVDDLLWTSEANDLVSKGRARVASERSCQELFRPLHSFPYRIRRGELRLHHKLLRALPLSDLIVYLKGVRRSVGQAKGG